MSAKSVYSISDENPDLKRQIGCMNGIFQLFDRQHLLGRSRRLLGQNHKRFPVGQNNSHAVEITSELRKTVENDQKNAIKEKQRVSTESSRTFFSSSSCSSSLSSIECSKTCQVEPPSVSKNIVPDTYVQGSALYQADILMQSRQQPTNIQDVVKDCLHREARGISVKPATRGGAGNHTLMYIDSPRPLRHSKSVDPRISGLKESFHILQRLQEVPKISNEGKGVPPSKSFRDAPRFSYDGRDSKDSLRSSVKLKEPPRLSLDSKANLIRGSNTEFKLNSHLGNLRRGHEKVDNHPNQQEDPGSHRQQSSVVAKLMGLESFPGPVSFNENQAGQLQTQPDAEVCFPGSTKNENKRSQIPVSPRTCPNELMSPQQRTADLLKKSAASSKVPVEPAPWKTSDGSKGSPAPASKNLETTTRAINCPPSVYGEIQKRLAQLEFKRSGKDLRALKQILEAMQKTRETIETKNEASNFANETDSNSSRDQRISSTKLPTRSPAAGINKGCSSPRSSKSPTVTIKTAKPIVKPANLPISLPIAGLSSLRQLRTGTPAEGKKESADKQDAKDLTQRIKDKKFPSNQPNHLLNKRAITQSTKSVQTSTTRESKVTGKTSTTMDIRQQQKKVGFEKQCYPKTATSASNRTNRHHGQHVAESHSQNRKPRPKSSNMHRNDAVSNINGNTRAFSSQGNLISSRSESNISVDLQVDDEVSSSNNSNMIYSKTQHTHGTEKHGIISSIKDKPDAKAAITSAEQPSPVSVLDAAFYGDELPSPIKKISIAFEGEEALSSDEEFNHSSGSTNSSINLMISHKEVEQVEPLIQNLKHLDAPIISKISFMDDSTSSDHRYIAEILSAFVLLEDSESSSITVPLHSSDFTIDPDFFYIIEQAKERTRPYDKKQFSRTSQVHHHDKVHRKLLFDVVTEILENKLLSQGSPMPWHLPKVLKGEPSEKHNFLGELCSKVDRLKNYANNTLFDEEDSLEKILCEDFMNQSADWMALHNKEVPKIALDIERLIFKDLITEVITSDAHIAIKRRASGHCRQQF